MLKHFDSFMQETAEVPCAWHLSFTAVLAANFCRKYSYCVSCWELIVARISLACVEGVRKGRTIPFKPLPRRLELAFQADLLRAPSPRIPVGG